MTVSCIMFFLSRLIVVIDDHYLNPIFIFKEFLNGCYDFLVSRNSLRVTKSWRIDDSQRKWNPESIAVVNVIGSNNLCLAVCLIFIDLFFDELESEVVFPFNAKYVINQCVNHSSFPDPVAPIKRIVFHLCPMAWPRWRWPNENLVIFEKDVS